MIKNIYTAITSTLQANVTELNQIGIYNSQFQYLGMNNDFDKVQETVFFPCAFIEFTDIDYSEQRGVTTQFGAANITVHVAIETLDSNDTSIFDLKTKVNTILHGFETDDFNKLVRTSEQTDNDHKNVYVYKINYLTSFIDNSTYLYKNNPDTTITGLTFNTEIENG